MNRKDLVSVLLMVAVAVAAAILVYVWSMGLIGTLQTGGGQQVREKIGLDEYKWTGSGLTLYLRNLGSANVVVDAVYISGTLITQGMNRTLPVGKVERIILNTSDAYREGGVYPVKIVTTTGGVFTFPIMYGLRTKGTGRPPGLEIHITPPGYPVVGGFWDVSAYVVVETADGTSETPANGAIVFLYLHKDNQSVNVWKKTDEGGLARFRRESDYQNVSFRAFLDVDNSTLVSGEMFPEKVEFVLPSATLPDYSPLALSVTVLIGFSSIDYFVISREGERKWNSVRWIFYILILLATALGLLITIASFGWSLPSATQYGASQPMTGGPATYDTKSGTSSMLFYSWATIFIISIALLVWLLIASKPVKTRSESKSVKE